jgi:hypothetical protein
MTTLTPPHMWHAEMTLPLPESRLLWFARTAQEWQMHVLEIGGGHRTMPPSLGDLLRDLSILKANHHRLDVQFAISIYLHAAWCRIWAYRQESAVFRDNPAGMQPGHVSNEQLDTRQSELVSMLQEFAAVTVGWHEMSAQESMVMNLLQMHLHVSLDELQLFSGKGGDEPARKVYPTLQRWCGSVSSRQALWHAGQIVRLARLFPQRHLKDFYAVAVHHAALAFWTWGVVRKASGQTQLVVAGGGLVALDGPWTQHAQYFIEYGDGPGALQRADGGGASLDDPRACMAVVREALTANFDKSRDSLPTMVENLCQLLQQLGDAGHEV